MKVGKTLLQCLIDSRTAVTLATKVLGLCKNSRSSARDMYIVFQWLTLQSVVSNIMAGKLTVSSYMVIIEDTLKKEIQKKQQRYIVEQCQRSNIN